MKTYIGTKQVKAEPMDELAAVEKGYARKNEDNHEWRQGNSRTITAHYHKLGYTDFSSDLCPHTGVMEYSPLFLGYTRDHKGKVVSHNLKDISNTIVASNHGRNGSTAQYLVEPMIYSSPHGFNFGGG